MSEPVNDKYATLNPGLNTGNKILSSKCGECANGAQIGAQDPDDQCVMLQQQATPADSTAT